MQNYLTKTVISLTLLFSTIYLVSCGKKDTVTPSNDTGITVLVDDVNVPAVDANNFAGNLNVDFGTNLSLTKKKISFLLSNSRAIISPAISDVSIADLITGIKFTIQAEDKTKKDYTLKMTVNVLTNLSVKTYYGQTDTIGFAIAWPGMADSSIITISGNFKNGDTVKYTFGSTVAKKVVNNNLIILKQSDIVSKQADLVDGNRLTIEASGVTKDIAVFSPSRLRTWQDLMGIAFQYFDVWGGYNPIKKFILVNNIKFPQPGTEGFPSTGFIPFALGAGSSFDGNNKSIENLYMNQAARSAFISTVIGSTADTSKIEIKNLTLINPIIKSIYTGANYYETSALVGYALKANLFLNNIIVNGGSIEAERGAGGLIGATRESACTISNCILSSTTKVKADMWAGGFIGYTTLGNIFIQNSTSNAAITATSGSFAGGFIGYNNSAILGDFTSSSFNGTINNSPSSLLVGHN